MKATRRVRIQNAISRVSTKIESYKNELGHLAENSEQRKIVADKIRKAEITIEGSKRNMTEKKSYTLEATDEQ